MPLTTRPFAQIVAIALLSVVVTQLIYIGLSNAGLDIERPIIWTTEAFAFLAMAVAALVVLARGAGHPVTWATIALGGVLNAIQAGMGIAMFPPLQDAGDSLKPAFDAVLAGAFFLYFAGKALFAVAAIDLGLGLLRSAGSAGKSLGSRVVLILTGLSGLAALVINVFAMGAGMDMVFVAGAVGTVATAFLALTLIVQIRE